MIGFIVILQAEYILESNDGKCNEKQLLQAFSSQLTMHWYLLLEIFTQVLKIEVIEHWCWINIVSSFALSFLFSNNLKNIYLTMRGSVWLSFFVGPIQILQLSIYSGKSVSGLFENK